MRHLSLFAILIFFHSLSISAAVPPLRLSSIVKAQEVGTPRRAPVRPRKSPRQRSGDSNIVPMRRSPRVPISPVQQPGRVVQPKPVPVKTLQCVRVNAKRFMKDAKRVCKSEQANDIAFTGAKVAIHACQFFPDDTISFAATAANEIIGVMGDECVKSAHLLIQAAVRDMLDNDKQA